MVKEGWREDLDLPQRSMSRVKWRKLDGDLWSPWIFYTPQSAWGIVRGVVTGAPAHHGIKRTNLMTQISMWGNYIHPNWGYKRVNVPWRATRPWEGQTVTNRCVKDQLLLQLNSEPQ